ncbi:DNA topoisomerase 3-beta-1-like protein [Dinothrombium tinctorium]|uniref:DNA topoisomerase n=1 Tax=Dinothrombium tinctorium TaxID=1965070 RepID=A0A3S3QVM5_9ACAR|nr:DNA topoisomerase 3-beta-1-like protein [Dinothrombium tinctorium]
MATVFMVAEKPSLAESLAKILSNRTCKRRKAWNKVCTVHEYYGEFNGIPNCLFKFTSVCGHIFTVDFHKPYNAWTSVDPLDLFGAPIVRLEANPEMKMSKFLASEAKNADFLVLWLDCDKEGEKICFEVIDAVKNSMTISFANPQTVFRARFSAITEKDVKFAMNNLTIPNELEAMSVDARQVADLRVGCAFTRFQTTFFQSKYSRFVDLKTVSFGPCQTPTLGFCVSRNDEIERFSPEQYFVLDVSVQRTPIEPMLKLTWSHDRVYDQNLAEACYQHINSFEKAVVIDISKEEKVKLRPLALNTVELLRVASSRLGFGPLKTMHIAERLYTNLLISYPRTETNQYPSNFDLVGTLSLQQFHNVWGKNVQELLRQGITVPRRGRDCGDHPPITPMRCAHRNEFSDSDSWRLYEYIVLHFIASLSGDITYMKSIVRFAIGEEFFTKKGKIVINPGFSKIFPWSAITNDLLGSERISIGDEFYIVNSIIDSRLTQAPSYLSESDLISLMENHGIGTDASIPTHINNICIRNYVTVTSDRKLVPTKLGIVLIHGYRLIDEELVLPTTRANIESKLNRISQGLETYENVLNETLKIFERKYKYFTSRISIMERVFQKLLLPKDFSQPNRDVTSSAQSFSSCGQCGVAMKLLTLPLRLFCDICNLTLNLPESDLIKPYKGKFCQRDNFEYIVYSSEDHVNQICPFCFHNSSPHSLKDHNSTSGQNSIVKEEHSRNENIENDLTKLAQCRECSRGSLQLKPNSGPPIWEFTCTHCTLTVLCFENAANVKLDEDTCPMCEAKMLFVEFKKSLMSNILKGCLFCTEELSSLIKGFTKSDPIAHQNSQKSHSDQNQHSQKNFSTASYYSPTMYKRPSDYYRHHNRPAPYARRKCPYPF